MWGLPSYIATFIFILTFELSIPGKPIKSWQPPASEQLAGAERRRVMPEELRRRLGMTDGTRCRWKGGEKGGCSHSAELPSFVFPIKPREPR